MLNRTSDIDCLLSFRMCHKAFLRLAFSQRVNFPLWEQWMFAGVGSSHALTITLLWGCTSNHWARTCEIFQRVGGRKEIDCSDFRLVTMKIIRVFRDLGNILFGAHFWIRVWMLFPPLRYQLYVVKMQHIRIETHVVPSLDQVSHKTNSQPPSWQICLSKYSDNVGGKRSKSSTYNFCGEGWDVPWNLSNKTWKNFHLFTLQQPHL